MQIYASRVCLFTDRNMRKYILIVQGGFRAQSNNNDNAIYEHGYDGVIPNIF